MIRLLFLVAFLIINVDFCFGQSFTPGYNEFPSVSKFGDNPEIDAGQTEDIWDGGGTYVYPTQARTHTIIGSTDDIYPDGDGARTIHIIGTNSDHEEISEDVEMNGATGIETVNLYRSIYRMYVLTAGSGNANMGDISAVADTDETTTAKILTGNNQTLMAIYSLAAGKTGYVDSYYASMNRSQTAGAIDVKLWVKSSDSNVWQLKHIVGVMAAGANYISHKFPFKYKITGPVDIKLQATATSNDTNVSGGFNILIK